MNREVLPPQAVDSTVWAVVGSPWGIFCCYLAAINLVTFLVFGLDKWKAKRKERHQATRRVPEKTLLVLSALGGSVGALLGMRVFHHKTLHKRFRFGVPAILGLQLLTALGLWIYRTQFLV